MIKHPLSAAVVLGSALLAGEVAVAAPVRPALEVVSIIGSQDDVRELPGSAALIDEQIAIEAPTDVNQLLKTVPGVYIREEDGFGLRPNIGIRGATSERSSKITLLEDGIMVAPAPYSDPAAYYFPTTMRVESIEVLKGAPLLRYGPQTTGGVVNLISTPIPATPSGKLVTSMGEYGSHDTHLHYGGKSGQWGFLLETVQRDSDGFKDIDRSSRDSGYDIEDYLAKLSWEGEGQSLLFKAQYSEEVSNETYVGLTDADFKRDATRRYGISALDQMDLQHEGYSLVYDLQLSERVLATATGYYNEFSRDWFKLDGSGALIDAANAGDAAAQAVLDGSADYTGLRYKHNSREYESSGIELNVAVDLDAHQLDVGGRLHRDEGERLQPVEVYDQINGSLVYDRTNAVSASDNRVQESDAIALWVTDSWAVSDALNVNLSLRYEDVSAEEVRYNDEARTSVNRTSANDSDEVLPGASFTYDIDEQWQVLAGVHKGFSPLGGGAPSYEEPETSVNYEAGFRFSRHELFFEAIAFHSDFSNKTENCSVANPCSNGETSGSFTTGEAIIQGLELGLEQHFSVGSVTVPLNLAYTYTKAEISDDEVALGYESGDLLADIPENTFSLRTGIETGMGWNNYLVAKYTDEMCSDIGCNNGTRLDRTEAFVVVDLISRYNLNPATVVFAKLENSLDEEAIVSRLPDGARPNKPRTASVGVELSF